MLSFQCLDYAAGDTLVRVTTTLLIDAGRIKERTCHMTFAAVGVRADRSPALLLGRTELAFSSP
jgi:hypothetical protein